MCRKTAGDDVYTDVEESTSREKSRILWSMVFINAIVSTTYLNVYILLPLYMEDNFEFSNMMVGILLASFQASFTFAAPLVGSILSLVGRRKAIIFGLVALSVSTAMFAVSSATKNPMLFYSLSFLARAS